jgi:hypothetical protein
LVFFSSYFFFVLYNKFLRASRFEIAHQILLYRSGIAALFSRHVFLPCSRPRPSGYSNMEDAMRASLTLLSLVLAGALLTAMPADAKQAAVESKAAPAAKKETKWQGSVVRIYKDLSQMDIRGGPAPATDTRKVAYDSSTEWTKHGKPGQQDEVKEGSFVIILGHLDDKGTLHASRIDLRLPR